MFADIIITLCCGADAHGIHYDDINNHDGVKIGLKASLRTDTWVEVPSLP